MQTNKTPPEGPAGMKKPRLTAMDRLAIEAGLDAGKTPYAIAQDIGRPPKTVMREIRGRAVESDKGAVGRVNNRCAHRYECTRRDVCKACYQRRSMQCKFCRQCNSHCPEFLEDKCARLESSPLVCNGCKDKNRCTLRNRFYRNGPAMENYRTVLVESRRGVNVTEAELLKFDKLLYRLTKNGDLPRKCRLRPRKGKGAEHKVDAKCRIGRDWECYQKFIAEHPGLPLTEMDTVEGTKGGKVLLTLISCRTASCSRS